MIKKIFLFCILILGFTLTVSAQETEPIAQRGTKQIFKVTKKDSVVYYGRILHEDTQDILISTEELGEFYIAKSEIASIVAASDQEFSDSRSVEGTFNTRYFFTNNAIPFKKKENYAMLHLYGPEFHFAVTDRLSIGLLSSWIASPLGVSLKYTVPTANEKINFSIGTLMLSSGYFNLGRGWGGVHWGTFTYGTPGSNISFSSGVGYLNLGFKNRIETPFGSMKMASVSSVGAIFKIGDRASFIFDSMFSVSERRNYVNTDGFINADGNPVEGPHIYNSGTEFTSFIMPAIRTQKSAKWAFQIGLVSIVQYSTIGYSYLNNTNNKLKIIPIPTFTFLIKL